VKQAKKGNGRRLKDPMNRISLSRLTDFLHCLERASQGFIPFELLE
jgi:hypothetical protein